MTEIKVLDASFASQVLKHGGKNSDGDPLWTSRFVATNPEAVLATHLDFLRAGSDIIRTITYQASIKGFVENLGVTESESLNLIRKAVNIAKEAVKIYMKETKNLSGINRPRIAGSCGPYGASLHDGSEYSGTYAASISKEFLKEWHRPRVEALIDSGVDFLAFETIPCEIEAEAIIELLKDYPSTKAWLAFSCRTDGKSIVDGSDFRKVASASYMNAIPGQIIAVGLNCIAPSAVSVLLMDINKDNKHFIPLIVYPNSGETFITGEGWKRYGNEPLLQDFIQEWLDMGVKYIGACCRNEDKDIISIKHEVNEWVKKRDEGASGYCYKK